MPSRLAALVALLSVAVPAVAGMATLNGSVGLRPLHGGSPTPLADAVVAVEAGVSPASSDAPHAVMEHRRGDFHPAVLAVAVGTTVDFPNHDRVPHGVSSTSPAERFDLGTYGPGQTRHAVFDHPGEVQLRCRLHPHATAVVVVHSSPYVAVTDAEGRYTIPGVPSGGHEVRIWHTGARPRRLPVSIPDGGSTQLDAQLEPEPREPGLTRRPGRRTFSRGAASKDR